MELEKCEEFRVKSYGVSLFTIALLHFSLFPIAATAAMNDPYVGYVYPSGISVGSTNRIIIGGQRILDPRSIWISGDGVKVVNIEKVPSFGVPNGNNQRKWLNERVYQILSGKTNMTFKGVSDEDLRGWRRCSWWEKMETLDPLKFAITARYLFTPRNPLQMSAALGERLLVTLEVDREATVGKRELVVINWRGSSVPHPFFVTAEPRVSEPLYQPPKNKKWAPSKDTSVHSIPVVLDGQIMPGETDVFRLSLHGGDELRCELVGRELSPYLGDAVPGFFNPILTLFDDEGKQVAYADDFHYLPDPVLRCKIPTDGIYRLEVRDNLYRGREDFVYAVTCSVDDGSAITPEKRAFVGFPQVPEGVECTDFIEEPGMVKEHDFTVEEPGTLKFNVLARRLGSPLDAVLRLYGPFKGFWFWRSGPLLATWDDSTNSVLVGSVPQTECDPQATWKFTEPGEYRLVVADRVGAGGKDYGYRLEITNAEPAFAAYALSSSFVLTRDKRDNCKFKVKVTRENGFAGEIFITAQSGSGVKVISGTIPADAEEGEVTFAAEDQDWSGMRKVRFYASDSAADDGKKVEVLPGDEVDQAFAYHHLLPTREFFVYRHPIVSGYAARPDWPSMPVDGFMPHRVIYRDLVPVLPKPSDADDAVLRGKLGTSLMHVKARREAVAYEPSEGHPDDNRPALAVLAGITRFVKNDMSYADGDERRVRTFALAASNPSDCDMLVMVPHLDSPQTLTPALCAEISRLRDAGFCFDFIDDEAISNSLGGVGARYKAVYVPSDLEVDEATEKKLRGLSKKRGWAVLFARELKFKEIVKTLSSRCRRERAPEGLRFARFGDRWGEGWYFVYNPTAATISGNWNFAMRGKPRTAYLMDVESGKIESATEQSPGKFMVSVRPGAAIWIYVSAFEEQ